MAAVSAEQQVRGPAAPAEFSWICRDELSRARLVDMDGRLHRARSLTYAITAATLVALAAVYPPWRTLPALGLALAIAAVTRWRAESSPTPEVWGFWGTVVGSQLSIATAVVLTGGPRSPLLPWFALGTLTLAALFDDRPAEIGAGVTLLFLLATSLSAGLEPLLRHPSLPATSLTLMVCAYAVARSIAGSDREHRAESVLDSLTGALNRRSLQRRLDELWSQAARYNLPISAVSMDLDCFKTINDRFGHATGDEVLQEVAYVMRKTLRHFDLLYRVGGDEFLLLLPGAPSEMAAKQAHNIRDAVLDARPAGLEVTVSLGVATVDPRRSNAPNLLSLCDAALYEAKHSGRNQACSKVSATEGMALV